MAAGACNDDEINKIQMLFNQAKITTDYRKVTVAAKNHKKETGHTSSAIELEDGTIICGHSSELLGCSAALILNVTKQFRRSIVKWIDLIEASFLPDSMKKEYKKLILSRVMAWISMASIISQI